MRVRNISIFCQRLLYHDHIIADGEMWEDLGRPEASVASPTSHEFFFLAGEIVVDGLARFGASWQEIQIMFAHYVNDFADELMRAAMAGNEDMARQARATSEVTLKGQNYTTRFAPTPLS